jgi:alpha-beta hydrolase superfamily lysophospholipase
MNEKCKWTDSIMGWGARHCYVDLGHSFAGIYYSSSSFGYSVTFERRDDCFQVRKFITKRAKSNEYIIVGHSLGAVLTRATLPRLIHKPVACFFLAPPTQVCKAARNFAHHRLAKLLMGEIGQLLANQQFMESLRQLAYPPKSMLAQEARVDVTHRSEKNQTMVC